MSKSLLFIPDISGFTNFVQTTEAEHSQHVIAELLEVLLAANTEGLELAEIEGDALFFYKEEQLVSKDQLLAQIETMYTAFFSHLKMMEKNRICPCNACLSAINLELKIVAHAGDLQFIKVQNNRKPFGETVIQAHRLLKNSVDSDNYVLISRALSDELNMSVDFKDELFSFSEKADTYDNKEITYIYSDIKVDDLKLKPFPKADIVTLDRAPSHVFERHYNTNATHLLELITNYKYRHLWSGGVDEIEYNETEVTRLGSEHICVIGSNHLDFKVIAKLGDNGDIIYGEETSSPPPVDYLQQFFEVIPISEHESKLRLELYLEAKSIFKKLLILLVVKRALIKRINEGLDKLGNII